MIFLQTSQDKLAFRDSARGGVNVFVKRITTQNSQTQTQTTAYEYATFLYVNLQATDVQILQAMFNRALKTPLPLEALKAIKLAEINEAYQDTIETLIADTPKNEQTSWNIQEAEAQALQTHPESTTPYIDALAQARGIEKHALAQKILHKAQAYKTLSATITGLRQRLEDSISQAQDAQALQAIDFSAEAKQILARLQEAQEQPQPKSKRKGS